MNETAQDLIAKIELPYDPLSLQQQGFDVSNTFVGKLAADGKAWVVSEGQRNVHVYVLLSCTRRLLNTKTKTKAPRTRHASSK